MGAAWCTVENRTQHKICVVSFNGPDLVYSVYENIYVINPGESCKVEAVANEAGLKVGVVFDASPSERLLQFQLWNVKCISGQPPSILTVTSVNSRGEVSLAGVGATSLGKQRLHQHKGGPKQKDDRCYDIAADALANQAPGLYQPAPALVAPNALPLGWQEVPDPTSGLMFYHNTQTGVTQWTKPGAIAPPIAPPPPVTTTPLPVGWQEVLDPATGRPFYHNAATGVTQWTVPVEVIAPPSIPPPIPPPPPAVEQTSEWSSAVDATSGKTYYYNTRTGVTTWTPP